jgi:hypothetical protein
VDPVVGHGSFLARAVCGGPASVPLSGGYAESAGFFRAVRSEWFSRFEAEPLLT